jgi:hypothetical protein
LPSQEKLKGHMARQVVIGYGIVGIFMAIFILFLMQGSSINRDLASPAWASAIAVILILPVLVPPAIHYLGPRLTGIKIPNVIEFTFSELKNEANLGRQIADTLSSTTNLMQPATEFAGVMTSHGMDIVNVVEQVRSQLHEVFVVDLKKGEAWVTPNLYFLALLLSRRTSVKQIVFVEIGQKGEEFVAMCSPEELLQGLGRVFPSYETATMNVSFRGLDLQTDSMTFFNDLRMAWQNTPPDFGNNQRVSVTSTTLKNLIGNYLHEEAIDYKAPALSYQEYRYILSSPNPYVAVISGGQLLMVLNRDTVALKIANELIKMNVQ